MEALLDLNFEEGTMENNSSISGGILLRYDPAGSA